MTETEKECRAWLKRHAPESRVLAAFDEPAGPWHHFEIETDQFGETIVHGHDDTGEFVVLECLEGDA